MISLHVGVGYCFVSQVMTTYRKPLNVLIACWIVMILVDIFTPLFTEESESLQKVENLQVELASIRSILSEKQTSGKISEVDYSRLKGELAELDDEVAALIEKLPRDSGWNWYSDLVRPLGSLILAPFFLYVNNRNEALEVASS